jgi:hypothetical protein
VWGAECDPGLGFVVLIWIDLAVHTVDLGLGGVEWETFHRRNIHVCVTVQAYVGTVGCLSYRPFNDAVNLSD